jgi:hypothetical protein
MTRLKQWLCRLGIHNWVYARNFQRCKNVRRCRRCLKHQTKYEDDPEVWQIKTWYTDDERAMYWQRINENKNFVNKKP